jgi:hypothetical protein
MDGIGLPLSTLTISERCAAQGQPGGSHYLAEIGASVRQT